MILKIFIDEICGKIGYLYFQQFIKFLVAVGDGCMEGCYKRICNPVTSFTRRSRR